MNLVMIYVFIIGIIVACSIWIFKKLPNWNITSKLLFSTTPFLAFFAINAVLINILECPSHEWCHNRLAVSFALSHGYRHINGFESGPVLTWMYGPMAAIAYLPTTITNSPMVAITFGTILSTFFFFLPILLFSFSISTALKPISFRSLVTPLFIFLLSYFIVVTKFETSLAGSAFGVHADAPSLGLAGTACAVLYFRNSKNSIVLLLVSAILAILSIWAKQNLYSLPVALLTYIFLVEGRKAFKQYLFCFLLSGTVISSIFIFVFGGKYLYFTMFEWPKSWPWKGSEHLIPGIYGGLTDPARISLLTDALFELTRYSLPFLGIILFYAVYQLKYPRSSGVRDFFKYNSWSMLVIVSAFMFPVSILSRVKLGGGTNSYSVTLYFLLCAVTAIFCFIFSSADNNESFLRRCNAVSFLTLSVVLLLTVRGFKYDYSPTKIPALLSHYEKNPVEQAYNYSKENPGNIYFPDIPLVSIMVEGKTYHSSLGLMDRMFYSSVFYNSSSNLIERNLVEKYKVTNKHFKECIPSSFQFVAFPDENPKNSMVLSYLPSFSRRVQLSELPGWIVFAK